VLEKTVRVDCHAICVAGYFGDLAFVLEEVGLEEIGRFFCEDFVRRFKWDNKSVIPANPNCVPVVVTSRQKRYLTSCSFS
jgi:hypothetical protein